MKTLNLIELLDEFIFNEKARGISAKTLKKHQKVLGLGIWVINNAPEIATKIDNPTVFEGTKYNEWENITFSDLEDARDNLILQKSIIYPENFNKANMQSGNIK